MVVPRGGCAPLSFLLVVAHLLGLLEQPRSVVNSAESAHGSVHALVHEVTGNDDPEEVHQNEVSPVIGCLGASVCHIEDVVVEQRSCVVQNVPVELAE